MALRINSISPVHARCVLKHRAKLNARVPCV
eukprot:SAG11_NODE_12899_length_680_cov_0.977625_1_plen_30_part_10